MKNITPEFYRQIMDNPETIRNVAIISQLDHGKTTITNSLIKRAGIVPDAKISDDVVKQQIPVFNSENYQLLYRDNLINIIDTIGHIDFSLEVAGSIRISDGALLIVDYIEGVCIQTESVLRIAQQEKVKPILMINKIDRAILQLKQDGEVMYQHFNNLITNINLMISTYNEIGEMILKPEDGEICFGSGKDNWAFSCATFAKIYAQKFKVEPIKLQSKLWGENYFDQEGKCWINKDISSSGKQLKRAFVQFIMDPICKLMRVIMQGYIEQANKMFNTLGLVLIDEEYQQDSETLLKTVMSKWLNAADTILDMIIIHLPSPKKAQKYRTDYLYTGPLDDNISKSMKDCNPQGPLIMYISRMIKQEDKLYAFGRVFSGTITKGQKIRIMGTNYKYGKKEDLYEKVIEDIVMISGQKIQQINDMACGNLLGLIGIAKYITKTCTISDNPECHTIKPIKQLMPSVVKFAVQPKNPQDLPKLMEGLIKLAKIDQLVRITPEETGEIIISGSGELHLEICIKQLRNDLKDIEIIVSEPRIFYKETVSSFSKINCLAKSPNKHTRLYGEAQPLDEGLTLAIEQQIIKDDPQERTKILVEQYDWEKIDATKIWAFGPENNESNILVDKTTGILFLNEIRDSVISAFQLSTKEGPLCDENLRGVRMNLIDCVMTPDSIHRGAGQIIPAAKRLVYASCLTAQPLLMEPISLTEITSPNSELQNVYNSLNMRRGIVISEQQLIGTHLQMVQAYIPITESFGFMEHLRQMTNGQVFSQMKFDHWANISGNPLENGTKANETMLQVRLWKGLRMEIPDLNIYLDKL